MITCFLCKGNSLKSFNITDFSEKTHIKRQKAKLWVTLKDPTPHDIELLGKKLDIHPSAASEILSKDSRIKYVEFENNTLIIIKEVKRNEGFKVSFYPISIILGKGYVVTSYFGSNETIEHLIENPKKVMELMKVGVDYLVHHIMDKTIDRYADIKNVVSDNIKKIEEKFLSKPSKNSLNELFMHEKIILEITQRADLMADVCQKMVKLSDNLVQDRLAPYFRDIYDQISRVCDSLRIDLDRINGIRESYVSLTSFKMNEAMHLLTIVMTIMMPMTVLTGFYGMNVRLPLQQDPYAATFIVLLMLLLTFIMFSVFKSKGLLGINEKK